MKIGRKVKRLTGMLCALTATLCPPAANASLSMSAYVGAIHQVGFTANVNLGHVVDAHTNFNRLSAGGSFVASCVSPYTGSITDERLLSSSQLFGNSLTVTIPTWLPATRPMPGFDNVPGGTNLQCTYNWKATAEEGSYTIGAGGIGFTIGGEKLVDGRGVPFEMYQPGGDAEISHGCLP